MPLDGVRVLDASNMIAGPMAGTILADFGADVIKIEHPVGGDQIRGHGYTKEGVPLWWKVLGRNKRSVTLNLSAPAGQEVFRQIAATVDVVIESYRVGTMAKWGLDYDELSRDHPDLIVAHITAFGQRGPRAKEPGFGTLAEAASGFAHRTGPSDGGPTLPPFGLADTTTGVSAALGIVTALYHRGVTGRGQELDISICEPLLSMLEPQVITYDQLGIELGRTGNRSEMNAPRDLYECSDGRWVAISASTTSTAGRLLALVGADELVSEEWMGSASSRRAHADEMDLVLVPWFKARPADEALSACTGGGVPATLVYSAADIVADEQFAEIGAIVAVEDDQLGTLTMPGVLFRLSQSPGRIRWAGPRLGQHTREVLEEVGLTGDQIGKLADEKVI